MDVQLFTLSDYASIDAVGKLTVAGIFDQLRVKNLPIVHPVMYVVARLRPSLGELSPTRQFALRGIAEDGSALFEAKGELRFNKSQSGRLGTTNMIVPVFGLRVEQAGRVDFVLLVDGNHLTSTSLNVTLVGE